MLRKIRLILFIGIFSLKNVRSQEDNNISSAKSLISKSFSELYSDFKKYNELRDTTNAKKSAVSYLNKAKANNDLMSLVRGYKYVASLYEDDIKIKYLDSALNITNDNSFIRSYSAYIYFDKGNTYYKRRKFKDAIDNLLKSNSLARKYNYTELKFDSNYLIAVLTDRIGNHKDAINIHQEYLEYSRNNEKIDSSRYLKTLFGLVVAHSKNNQIETALALADEGLIASQRSKNDELYYHFLLSSGVLNHQTKQHKESLNCINKSLKYFLSVDNKPNLAVAYFYKGKTLYDLGDREIALEYFKKVDTIFNTQRDILPELREGYQILIDHYQKSDDLRQQLLYTNKLREVDSVLNQNYRYLQTNIIQDYYTPLLINQNLENKSKSFWKIIFVIGALLILSVAAFIYSNSKKRLYQKKFEMLIAKSKDEGKVTSLPQDQIKNSPNIPENIINSIIKGLENFERNHHYINSKYTLNLLAKELQTNSSYLSKTINSMKDKSFSQYINDLRIDYTIETLKHTRKYDLYTIKGIAEEVGFKSSESFSKAFYKRTGIYPSYFIKKLKKEGLDL
ncbi:helix-turn-helix domain-containing protein [Aquimarina sp. SS2-1]|uniref:helix-turn-helix domain-containing protein n=1 Tax=Aquimarina besae TaxID=3342247 RepID=UPI00366B0157